MPVTIVAEAGSSTANSFVTLDEAEAYMAARLNASAWSNASEADKNIALVEATRELTVLAWVGERVTDSQALSWPREFAVNPDASFGTGTQYYADTLIPQRVKDATSELAFQFLNLGTTDLAALDTTSNIARKVVDVLETDYIEPSQRATGLARFPRVVNVIAPLLCGTGATTRVVRG
jgi:hypothetical protein